jgi:prepilin signal peptidase PulO-like enzyme (type II secretory pathway)
VLITVIDLEHRLILFVVIIPACLYALVGAALFGPEISDKITFQDYLIGGLSGFALFFIMYLGGMLFTVVMANARKQPIDEVAFGYGDVMLATLSGFMLGWQALLFALTIAVFAGGAGALLFLVFRMFVRGKYEWFTALPYGQYIVFGTVVMMLWRTPVLNWLQNVR